MHFQITHDHVLEEVRDVFGRDIVPEHDEFTWALVKKDGEVVARGPHDFATEAAARSNIAAAKRAFKATQRCKVLSPDG